MSDGTMVTPDPANLPIDTDALLARYEMEIGKMAGTIFRMEAQLRVTQAALRESALALKTAQEATHGVE